MSKKFVVKIIKIGEEREKKTEISGRGSDTERNREIKTY